MKRILFALFLAAVVQSTGTYLYAQTSDPAHGGTHTKTHAHEAMASDKGYSLTPEQKDKLREMRRNFIGENAQLIGAIVAKRLELRSLWTDPKSDPKAILDKEKELSALLNQIREKIAQARLEARKTLTPEQIAHWKPWRLGRMRHGGMMEGLMGGDMMGHGGRSGHGGMMGQGVHGGMMQGGMMGGKGMTDLGKKKESSCECSGK